MARNQHVTPHPNGWQVKGAGNNRATVVTNTQREAIRIGKEIAKIKGLSCLFTTDRDRFENAIRTGMTCILPRDK